MPPIHSKSPNKCEIPKRFFWGRKLVTEKVFLHLQKKRELGKAVGKLRSAGVNNESNQTNKQSTAESIEKKKDEKKHCIIEGRRIVQLKVLAENLYCKDCKNVLSLKDIQKEKQHGLASVFYVKCSDCQTVTGVHTDSQHFCKDTGKYHYDSNTNAAAGALDSGIGNTHLNKFFAVMNMPPLHWKTFKIHEKEVGLCIEKMAEESCKEATLAEKRLTINNLQEMKKL
ncbi:hypothetical protein PV326_012038, partial [Microctonus aethiopoides]